MSKKKFSHYVVVTKRDAGTCDSWEEAKRLRDSTKGATILGGYYSQEEADEARDKYMQTVLDARNAEAAEVSSVPLVDTSGRRLDVFAVGVYSKKHYGGGFAVYEGETLLHSGKYDKIPKAAKGSGAWAGLLPAVVQGVRWALAEGAGWVMIHIDCEGPAKLASGEYKAKKAFTQTFVEMMRPLAGCVAFAPVPEEGAEELEGFRIAREQAEDAAGIAGK